MQSNLMSASVQIKPKDPRCKYWAKIVRAETSLPMPREVDGAADIPGPYLRVGEEELFAGDFLFEGEARHHRHMRGWDYCVSFAQNGEQMCVAPCSAIKASLKSQGLDPSLLPGSGDIAACVRIAHGIRAGLVI